MSSFVWNASFPRMSSVFYLLLPSLWDGINNENAIDYLPAFHNRLIIWGIYSFTIIILKKDLTFRISSKSILVESVRLLTAAIVLKTFSASWYLPFIINHRGDSGAALLKWLSYANSSNWIIESSALWKSLVTVTMLTLWFSCRSFWTSDVWVS